MSQEAHEQQPQRIMRDFLGLGKLAGDDHAEGATGFPTSSNDCSGSKYPLFNLVAAIDHDSTSRRPADESNQEGIAETFGLTCPNRWRGMVPNPARPETNVRKSPTQLTIFYGGHVNVYNNIPVERAEAIMQMAAKGDPSPFAPFGMLHPFTTSGFFQSAMAAENLCFNSQMVNPVHFAADDQASQNGLPAAQRQFEAGMPNTPSTATSAQSVVPKALPLARKASLARFLEKRKERMQMMSPYFKKQLVLAQGEQMASPLPNAALIELYDQYLRKPNLGFGMHELTDRSSFNIPAEN